MDATQALADLTEISSQVVHVAILEGETTVLATTVDKAHVERFLSTVNVLLAEAESLRQARNLPDLAQLEVATHEGSVFLVRRGAQTIVATTRPDPTVGLVFYDLKHCLGSIQDGPSPEPETAPDPAPTPAKAAAAKPESAADPSLTPGRHARRKADASA